LSDYAYYNTGVATDPALFDDPERHLTFRRFFRVLGVPNYRNLREDVGQFALASDPDDWGKFRATSLREVETYITEMAPSTYSQNYGPLQALQPTASDHILFAVQEALSRLDTFEYQHKEDK